jgi:subtilisin family serine protease
MQSEKLSRRRMLSRLGLTAATGTLAGALSGSAAEPEPSRAGPSPMALNVQDFGAVGDGTKDDTEAFAAAIKAAAETGNGAVFVPRGRYLIKSNLDVPEGVMLEGVFRAPSARTNSSARSS